MTKILNDNIWNRQLGLIHPEKLQMPILIVGAGSIGSWAALALSKLGCSNITIMDGDIIEEHNAGSQVYKASDEGLEKVQALSDKLRLLTDLTPKTIAAHWNIENPEHIKDLEQYEIVIAAVDNITIRAQLFNTLKGKNIFYIDGRMAGNELEIYSTRLQEEEDQKAYEATLFSEEETSIVPCSERSVVYNVFLMGGLIADIVKKHANEEELPKEILMDLYNFTLYK